MSEGKHTPGPWKVVAAAPSPRGGTGTIYCLNHPTSERLVHNARLIAAAPDMLAALESLLNVDGKWDAMAVDYAHAIIAKAKGE